MNEDSTLHLPRFDYDRELCRKQFVDSTPRFVHQQSDSKDDNSDHEMIFEQNNTDDEDEPMIKYRVNHKVYPPELVPIDENESAKPCSEKATAEDEQILEMADEDDAGLDPESVDLIKTQIAETKENGQTFEFCPEQFVDLSKFPSKFSSEDEALTAYNALGLQYKIQFKKFQRVKNDQGVVTRFMLCCHKRCLNKWKLNQGIMIKQNDLLDCPVQVRFKWSPERQCFIRCKRMFMHHTHHLEIKDRHFVYNEQVIQDIRLYNECGLQPNMIQQLINKKYAVNARYSDVYHMVKVIRKQQNQILAMSKSDVDMLIEMLKQLSEKDSNFKFAYQLENQEDSIKQEPKIDRLFFQTPMMSKYYNQYSDVVFMDATYKTNKHELALTIISSVSGEGRNIILGIAFLSRETSDHYIWLLRQLLEFNQGKEPGTIITDFDSSMCAGIETVFNKTTHLLCQWHMMQNLKKHFVFLNKTKKLYQKQLYNHIIECIFTPDPRKFQELQDVIFQQVDQLDEQRLTYLRQLFQIKEKWAHAFQPHNFNAGLRTISRAESVNHMIKHRQRSRQSICDLFKLILDVEKRVVERSFTDHKHERKDVVNHPMLRDLYSCYTRWAYEQMLFQYRESHKLAVKHVPNCGQRELKSPIVRLDDIEGDSAIFQVKDFDTREKYQVVILMNDEGEITCNCEYFRGINIYCEHIFAVFNRLQIKTPLKFKKLGRWTRECQGNIHRDEEIEFKKKYDLGESSNNDQPLTFNGEYGIRGRSQFLPPNFNEPQQRSSDAPKKTYNRKRVQGTQQNTSLEASALIEEFQSQKNQHHWLSSQQQPQQIVTNLSILNPTGAPTERQGGQVCSQKQQRTELILNPEDQVLQKVLSQYQNQLATAIAHTNKTLRLVDPQVFNADQL